jgi:hypothetical protein
MATVEGLAKVNELMKQSNEGISQINQQSNRKKVAQEAMGLFNQGKIEEAYAHMLGNDPELAKELAPSIKAFAPKLAEKFSFSETEGQLSSQTDYGSNPRQLLDARLAGEKEMLSMRSESSSGSEKEKRLSNQFNQQMGFKYQQAAENSATYKSAINVINEMPQLKSLLDDAYKNGGQSLSMLGPRIAKGLAGEVGVLTEQDVTRYIRNPALADWLLSGANKKFEGKLTAQDYANLTRLGSIMEKNANEKLNKAYQQAATKMSRNMRIPLEDAEMLVNPTIDDETKSIIMEQHKDKVKDAAPKQGAAAPASAPLKAPAGAKPGDQVISKKTGQIYTVQADGTMK